VSGRSVLIRKFFSAGIRLRRSLISQRFGFGPSAIYGDSFYSNPACGAGLRHAAAIARLLYDRYHPERVFDFGCGEGGLIGAFQQLGANAAGCEGSVHGIKRCPPGVLVFQADLRKPVVLNRQADLVSCIEVAEHLPRSAEETLVGSIVGAASQRIVFSASGPGQLGDDHINLRPQSYWIDRFAAHGFVHNPAESDYLRGELRKSNAPEWWQNTLVLERRA
jgi:hypothetical protein